jgi:hypothetical protein
LRSQIIFYIFWQTQSGSSHFYSTLVCM